VTGSRTRAWNVGLLLLVACAPRVDEPPHVSLQKLRLALADGDTTATTQYVDVEAIVARFVADLIADRRDSLNLPDSDTPSTAARTLLDSVQGETVARFRRDLGLSTATPSNDAAESPIGEQEDPYPNDDVLAQGVEIVGDGAVRYVGDTALVDRLLRYAYLDTSMILKLALVPVGRSHWRIVAYHNGVALFKALRQRQEKLLERANKTLRDSIHARVVVRDLSISKEPLEEWERYAAEVRVTVHNQSERAVVLHAAHLVGPHLSLNDSIGQVLTGPVSLPAAATKVIVWSRTLRGDHPGPYDLVSRPNLYRVEIADVEVKGVCRMQLYRSWEEFIDRNPIPPRTPGGVLALTLASVVPQPREGDGYAVIKGRPME
jgi:hypothetical protein